MNNDCLFTIDRAMMLLLSGLAAWLSKVWATRISGKENDALSRDIATLKAELEKGVFIHKIQFEKEFEVYLDLSRRIHAFRTAYFTLNSILKNVSADPATAVKKQTELQNKFINSYEALRDGLEEYRPFYAKEIYELSNPIIQVAIDELIFIQFPIHNDIPRYEEIQQQKKKILATANSIVEAIRKRISVLQIKE